MRGKGKGFTLVELAIVLVVIGIIIGAVLKGQEMIFNAKVKRTVSLIKELMAAVHVYYDRYGYYPGDDPTASQRWGINAPNGNGDGTVCMQHWWGPCNATDEYKYLIRHLRYANILSGDPNEDPPIISVPFGQKHPTPAMPLVIGTAAHFSNKLILVIPYIPSIAAEMVDRTMDDGLRVSGTVWCKYNDARNWNWGNNSYDPNATCDLHVFF